MFNESRSSVEQNIEDSSDALTTIDSLRQAMVRRRNEGAVNTLMAWLHDNGITPTYRAKILGDIVPAATTKEELRVTDQEYQNKPANHQNCLVSSYAARTVIEGIETDVNRLRTAGRTMDIRALEGYALEADFQKTLKIAANAASQITVFHGNGDTEQWSVVSYRLTDDVFEALVENRAIGSWIWVGGFQAGFDAVHIYGDGMIRFVQATAGKKHDYLFSAIYSLLERLALENIIFTHVDFVVVRPQDDNRIFTKGDVSGRLGQGWRDFSGNDWDLRDPTRNARIVKIAWSS